MRRDKLSVRAVHAVGMQELPQLALRERPMPTCDVAPAVSISTPLPGPSERNALCKLVLKVSELESGSKCRDSKIERFRELHDERRV